MDLVVLDAELEEMVAAGDGDVIEQLNPRVVVRNRQEERHAQAVAPGEIHGDVGERTSPRVDAVRPECRAARTVVRPRPVFTRVLKAEFVGQSEEHTSELQSQSNLVCRLLLEKKKK